MTLVYSSDSFKYTQLQNLRNCMNLFLFHSLESFSLIGLHSRIFALRITGVAASNTALPSVCLYTFLNTQQSVNNIALSADGSQVTAGCAGMPCFPCR